MNLVWAVLVIALASGLAIAALLLVRRGAPEGGYFEDGDRAAGLFGVLAGGFAILLGFVIFLAFESFDDSRAGAETEALTVGHQFETAHFLPPAAARRLEGELICYGRSVVGEEWPRLEDGTLGNAINPWGLALFITLRTANPTTAAEGSAFDKWLDQTSDREQARSDRIHGAEGIVPDAVWLALFFMAGVIFVFMLFFADSAERPIVQAVGIGSVVAVIVASFFVIRFLESPFHSGTGGLRPVAMERTLEIIEQTRRATREAGPLPCDANGRALEAG
jgi:hypothetical protein